MVENRKLFYAISLMLLTCCQIITMLPHNTANSESTSLSSTTTTTASLSNGKSSSSSSSSGSNSENKTAEMLQETRAGSKSWNNNNGNDFLIIAAERNQQKQQTIVSSEEGKWESQENDSRPADNIDDLIFLDKRPINQHHQQHEKEQKHDHQQQEQQEQLRNKQKHYEFHHITMDVNGGRDGDGGVNGNSNANSNSDEDDTDSLTDTTYPSMIVVDDDGEEEEDGVPHEIELQPDINEEVTPLNVTPLDLSDFLSLIPATKVKTIVNHYYRNDPEVQRAHAFMSSHDFLMLKQHIIAVPEMSAFLHYLNNSGLDLVKFVTALTNLTAYENTTIDTADQMNFSIDLSTSRSEVTATATAAVAAAVAVATTEKKYLNTEIAETNVNTTDIGYAQKQNTKIITAISNIEMEITATTTKTTQPETITESVETITTTTIATEKEQLNGLHGLVDSVLDVLPQDQILATFFDKLEANEQFSKLVDNIGSPEFAKILNNMQNSLPLRNLIFTLHNNGIYVIRIVDSLRSYFFLGGF